MSTNHSTTPNNARSAIKKTLLVRSTIGGALMGLANLVPGVSGGTMLLAAGIYREFVDAIAQVTRLKLRIGPLLILGFVGGAAVLAILLGAGLLKDLVVHQRWLMYALFVGLTLGGVPLVWRPITNKTSGYWLGASTGLAAMIGLFALQMNGASAGASESSFVPLAVAGAAGASAMILPGLSGGYLLLLLGQYVPILSGVDRLKQGLIERNVDLVTSATIDTAIPVGVGVVLGVVLVSNLVQWFFRRFEAATYGVLLGLLLGATVGLWPFQEPTDPVLGETVIKGQVVTESNLADFEVEDYPLRTFSPSPQQAGVAIGLVLLGCCATLGIARLGGSRESAET